MSLAEFGTFLGIAYQIIDDTLDYFSNFKTSGKNAGNDLKEGKMSLPLIICYRRCNKSEKKLVEHIIGKNNTNQNDFRKIISLMEKYNVRNDCIKKAIHFSIMAKDSLGIFPNSVEKTKFLNLVDYLVHRTS